MSTTPNPAPNPPSNPTPPAPTPPPAPEKRYYRKELVGAKFYVGASPVEIFEILDGNRGVGSLDANDPLVPALDKAAHDQIGGIVKISREEFENLKKNHPNRGTKGEEQLKIAPRADSPRGKAFIPPPPQGSAPAVVPPANAPIGDAELAALIGKESNTPQRPPDRPDFTSEGSSAKFSPKTARAGTGKPTEPTPA